MSNRHARIGGRLGLHSLVGLAIWFWLWLWLGRGNRFAYLFVDGIVFLS